MIIINNNQDGNNFIIKIDYKNQILYKIMRF